jgi:hypothetical protein
MTRFLSCKKFFFCTFSQSSKILLFSYALFRLKISVVSWYFLTQGLKSYVSRINSYSVSNLKGVIFLFHSAEVSAFRVLFCCVVCLKLDRFEMDIPRLKYFLKNYNLGGSSKILQLILSD